jgi:uncharacterized membrane protein YkvA (DUF1232 family)
MLGSVADPDMTDASIDPRYLEMFPQWLRSLGEDAAALAESIAAASDDDATRSLVGGLNYIFKSLDLIPDGIDDIGFLDDAFVLRVASAQAVAAMPGAKKGVVERLSDDARAVGEFLGDDAVRLEKYVLGLRKGAARGRTVEEILGDAAMKREFLQEVKAWAAAFQSPSFTRDPRTLVKMRAFLRAKLA